MGPWLYMSSHIFKYRKAHISNSECMRYKTFDSVLWGVGDTFANKILCVILVMHANK